ncbi:hypothetical protein OsI_15422 [Oryza sativa Indica Group]|uniref:Terpene synthase metal-binding domain-containing protein n=2 Tax=Oryza sativa TaxID=4530 RepID=A3ASK9_ORYSJ|nr:hypothetical protein OsI_15422 [Oryza sativa Indica Group]EAZ30298.1 hypothetical protein OsJ_14344 [Oryza sativa Japonica Group]
MRQRADNLREKVRTLFRTSGDVVARMKLVDSIQHLGVGHLFNEEISTTLSDIHASEFTSSSLYEVALRFRLLREHGLWVSPATFNIFKDDDGRWWKDLTGYVGLSYLRDRLVESYTWSQMLFYEEGLALTRIIFTKIIVLMVIMDDTYDSHATIQECRKLNEAIQRWDESALFLLPEYLKKFYNELLNNFKEFEDQVAINDKYRVAYAKKEFQKLSHYFLQEAEWSHNNYKPSFEEQVALSTKTSTVQLLCVSTTVGRGDAISSEAFQWAASSSTVTSCAKILRFMNDIASFKCGKNKGDMVSTVECYMNEHKVISEVAFAKLDSLIEDEWRTMNHARYEHHQLLPVVQRVLNMAISIMFFYDKRKDAYTFSTHLQEIVRSLFVNPIPI